MPTKTATLHESEGVSQGKLLAESQGAPQGEPVGTVNGKTASTQGEDDGDPADSEAETEHIEPSPTKKRHISHGSSSITKRFHGEEPEKSETVESIPSPTEDADAPGDEPDVGASDEEAPASEVAKPRGVQNGKAKATGKTPAEPKSSDPEDNEKNTSSSTNDAKAAAENLSSSAEGEDSGAEQDVEADDAAADDSVDEDNDNEEQIALQKQRQEAISFLTEIEVQFADFRNQVHEDQMARYELEIQMCVDGNHPELTSIQASIKNRHDERLDRGRALHDYQLKCIHNQTVAMRAHLHQQFVRERFDLRSELLSETTRKWYQVNYERRAADRMVPDYGYRGQGQEPVSRGPILAAIQKFAGFPAAPRVTGASVEERNEDLAALGLY